MQGQPPLSRQHAYEATLMTAVVLCATILWLLLLRMLVSAGDCCSWPQPRLRVMLK